MSKAKNNTDDLNDWNAKRSSELAGIEYDIRAFRFPEETIRECVLRLAVGYAELQHRQLEIALISMKSRSIASEAVKGGAK